MIMVLMHVLLAPLMIVPFVWLLRKKYYLDAAIFAVVASAGYVLWLGIANYRPFVITVFIEKLFKWVG